MIYKRYLAIKNCIYTKQVFKNKTRHFGIMKHIINIPNYEKLSIFNEISKRKYV